MSKLFGSIRELVRVVFRQNSQEITLDSNSGTTYTADRTVELPPVDANETIVGEAATQTVTNKTIDADLNTISNLAHGSEVDSPSSGVHGVTGSVVGTTDTQTLTNKTIDAPTVTSYEAMPQVAEGTVPTPSAGTLNRFVDSADSTYKYKDSNGDVFPFGSGGGSGTGEINYIENSGGEVNADGWAAYKDAAVSDPIDGVGGSPSVGMFRVTTQVLRGDGILLLDKPAGDLQGEGVSYDFSIDPADQNKLLKLTFDYKTSANYESEDIGVYIYDVGQAQFIELGTNTLSKADDFPGGHASLSFVTNSSISYRLIFHVKTVNALAYDFRFDNVIVGPGNTTIAQGAIITPWEDFTPTWTNGGTISTEDWKYRRVGESMEIQGYTEWSGTGGGGLLLMEVPAGVTINSDLPIGADYHGVVGNGGHLDDGTSTRETLSMWVNDTTRFGFLTPSKNSLIGTEVASGDVISATVRFPIEEWAATGTVILPTTDDLSITAWQSITLAANNLPGSSQEVFYRRNGDTMILRGNVTAGGAATGNISLTLPAGFTIDYDKLPLSASSPLGPVSALDVSGPGRHVGIALTNGSSTNSIILTGDDGQDVWNATVPFTIASGDRIELHSIELPIVEWANLGKVPAVGIQEATETAPGLLRRYQEEQVTLDNEFTSGTLTITRVNNVVTISGNGVPTHASDSQILSSVGLIPTWALPKTNAINVFYMTSTYVARIFIKTNGQVQFDYRDWTGAYVNQTGSGTGPVITYNVDE